MEGRGCEGERGGEGCEGVRGGVLREGVRENEREGVCEGVTGCVYEGGAGGRVPSEPDPCPSDGRGGVGEGR